MTLRLRLISELTQLDQREEANERKRRYPVNYYRLGHYLGAGDEVADAVDTGIDPATAFAQHFTPTRGMHTVARRLGLTLDVERGRWISTAASPEPDQPAHQS